jgi:hypothetical protein
MELRVRQERRRDDSMSIRNGGKNIFGVAWQPEHCILNVKNHATI